MAVVLAQQFRFAVHYSRQLLTDRASSALILKLREVVVLRDAVGSKKIAFSQCPECTQKVGNPSKLEKFLTMQKLSVGWGKSLTEGEVVTSYGLRIAKTGKNFVQGGGSKEIEQLDLSSITREDLPAGPAIKECNSDVDDDTDGWPVDDLGQS